MIGYILGIILIPKYISQKNALIGCTLLGLALSFGVVWADFDMTLFGHQANASIFFLNALGFPNALIYAGIWPLSIHGLGKFTKTGSSLLIGIMRQCHLTFGIWSLCRPVQFAYRLLGTYSLLYLSGILCHQRA